MGTVLKSGAEAITISDLGVLQSLLAKHSDETK